MPGAILALAVAWLPAQAVDCWPAPLAQHQAVPGVAGVAAALQRAAALLRQDATLQALPNDLRLQIKSTVSPGGTGQPLAVGEVGVHGNRPAVWGPGCSLQQAKADYVSPFNVGVRINSLDPVWHTLASPSSVADAGYFVAAAHTLNLRGDRLHGGRVLVLSSPQRPALRPLTVDEYLHDHEQRLVQMRDVLRQGGAPHENLKRLESNLRELQAHRSSLSPAQRQQAAALGPQPEGAPEWATVAPDAPDAVALMKPNPDLWRGAKPGEVRVLTISVWMNNEGDALQEALEQWLRALDPRPFEALLSP